MIRRLRRWYCRNLHWAKGTKELIMIYKNGKHRYYCNKCKYEYDEK